ncbi:GNAT family N-acetyltransferase [Streptomonospora arabica]|uniref:GNAT family N-acetyltransferase n=1 Tax=Streptomonospora arabica TaxID=412417 RepID=A0ABV9SHA2_9ACTN
MCAVPVPEAADSLGSVRALQERAARAQPAERIEVVGDWWLRHAPGRAWWLGAALPHGDAGAGGSEEAAALERGIDRAERFYAGHGAPALFQITPGACPDGLDGALAGRGYRRLGSLSLQAAPASAVRSPAAPPGPVRVAVEDRPTGAWLDAWRTVHGGTAEDADREAAVLARVGHPSAYARARVGTATAAVGRAVADTGWAGVFGMATLPTARGNGAARTVLAALADWAAAHGADRLYLQVERSNDPAVRLYRRAGFTEVCGYHYRTAV